MTLLPHFEEITFEHFPREENQLEDTLATMSSMFKVKWDNEAPRVFIWKLDEPADLEAQEYPEGTSVNDKKFLRRFATKFFLKIGRASCRERV